VKGKAMKSILNESESAEKELNKMRDAMEASRCSECRLSGRQHMFDCSKREMSLAAKCLLEIQTFLPTADARVVGNTAQFIVPLPRRSAFPLVLGSGPDFDVAGVRAVRSLGDNNPEFAKRSSVYADWTA
jgi:hypothetical protein